jgi:Zn-finger nucleic acid-binding protein
MICPTCNSDMIGVEYNHIELDYCGNCHGVWFDAGELELMLKTLGLDGAIPFLNNLLEIKEVKTTEKERRCPLCRQKMKKANLETKILVDVCSQGEGIWFDGGEVGALVRELTQRMPPGKTAPQSVINFLGEVIKPWDNPEQENKRGGALCR